MNTIFKNVRERSTAKNYRPVSLFSVAIKDFEELVSNRIIGLLYFDFQYGFNSSQSTANLLTELLWLLTGLGLLVLYHLI